MLNIVVDENMPAVEHYLGEKAKVTALSGRDIRREHLLQADALLVRSVTRVDESLLSGTPVCFVGTATSGVDHIDRNYLASHDIAFAHAPGANANSVVEYVLAAIGSVADYLERLFQDGKVGIIGYGNVGAALANRLQALGIDWCAVDPWLPAEDIPCPADLSGVLSCDVICLHPELTQDQPWPSLHLLGVEELAQLGDEQLLINASRGPIIDSRALLSRLSGEGAPDTVLDVWEHEPLVDPDLLAKVCLGTAHIAGYSYDSKILATQMICNSLLNHAGLKGAEEPFGLQPDPVILQSAQGQNQAHLLRALLQQRYRIEQDDALLRRSIADNAVANRAAAFDQLRKNYRERRELAGSQALVADESCAIDLVRALGCQPLLQGE